MPGINNEIDIIYQSTESTQIEIRDLIGNPPGWLLRSGIMMIAIVTSIILIGTYFFKYPDKLSGQGVLTSNTPPIEIISRSTGYIEEILIEEGEYICKGDAIIYINNTTDQDQLAELQQWIEKYENVSNPNEILNLPFKENLQLGLVQSEYANLQLRYKELQRTLKDRFVFKQIRNLSREIAKINSLNQSQEKEKIIFAKELTITNKDYIRNEGLKNDGAVSALDLERAKTTQLQKERQYEGMNNLIISNSIRIEQLELDKLKLREQRSQVIDQNSYLISETIARIKSSIENWNSTYIIKAPIDGKLTFGKDITNWRNLKQGQLVGYIIPQDNEQQYISALYPSINIGKVEIGQKAILKFDAYPYKEFGVIVSHVAEMSSVPEMKKDVPVYELKIPINKKIITDHGKEIEYKPNMTLTIEVITEDKTVFERIFNQFLTLISK